MSVSVQVGRRYLDGRGHSIQITKTSKTVSGHYIGRMMHTGQLFFYNAEGKRRNGIDGYHHLVSEVLTSASPNYAATVAAVTQRHTCEYVNQGFHSVIMACKKCGELQK
jgi:hypothetical protein